MKSEKVRYGDLRRGAPYYLNDPLDLSLSTAETQPYYTGLTLQPNDTTVWTVYETWASRNPWLKTGPEE